MFKMSNSLLLIISLFFIGHALILQNTSAHVQLQRAIPKQTYNYRDPKHWPGYEYCVNGTKQSPINIDTKTVRFKEELPPLKVVYGQFTDAKLTTYGLGAKLLVNGTNELTLFGETYNLQSLSWHTPSEHTFNGKKFVAELQQRFASKTNRTHNDATKVGWHPVAIIATVYNIGAPDPIVGAIEPEMAKLAKQMSPIVEGEHLEERVPVDKFTGDLFNKIPTTNYITYKGSITYPPCVEGVKWFITDPQTMSANQEMLINKLQSKSNRANARAVQRLNGRIILTNKK